MAMSLSAPLRALRRGLSARTPLRLSTYSSAVSFFSSMGDSGLPDIIITPIAAKKLAEAAKKQNEPQLMLRVAVEGGGCSGFKYIYVFEKNAPSDDEDIVFDQHGGKVVVDKESLEFIKGSTVDFEQEMIRSAFVVINNPNASSGCGCGSSFDLKE